MLTISSMPTINPNHFQTAHQTKQKDFNMPCRERKVAKLQFLQKHLQLTTNRKTKPYYLLITYNFNPKHFQTARQTRQKKS